MAAIAVPLSEVGKINIENICSDGNIFLSSADEMCLLWYEILPTPQSGSVSIATHSIFSQLCFDLLSVQHSQIRFASAPSVS